ncbi:MAG: hypothetical protein Q8L45_16105 [Xanthomonadaceae bacterium]|nr:hypothetical protein [Xanthomonadaceae bacterium]MDP2185907.1 hypothetical protein [Xanthomonadales bacterium]MDZ4116319.1 hypothetical protein [Xanthomonadaceae bacterium]
MDLLLLHGRETADELMDDIGFRGPVLHGVHSFQRRYRETATVKFNNLAWTESAMRRTGWPVWDDNVLEILWQDDLIKICDKAGIKSFYGDMILCDNSLERDIDDLIVCVSNVKKNLNVASIAVERVLNEVRPKE